MGIGMGMWDKHENGVSTLFANKIAPNINNIINYAHKYENMGISSVMAGVAAYGGLSRHQNYLNKY
ncbi:MAG TPA: hypothetical protein C5S50_01400 [Methanosarcinaceae archaeon]|nr:hypothetical protein [ANME-2 cluster archaeon]HJH30861.1 hypothetical protein [Methanosarcinaceae archaeon]